MKRKLPETDFESMSSNQPNMKSPAREKRREKNKDRGPYMVDNKLIPRIRKFLDGKSAADNTDTETIINQLQKIYPDYRRKKRITFRHSVSRAMDIILQDFEGSEADDDVDGVKDKKHPGFNISKEECDIDSDDSFSAEGEYAEITDTNGVNNLVTGLYSAASSQNPSRTTSPANTPNPISHSHNKIKQPGFVRCQSDPLLNKNSELSSLSNLGYVDRGENPSTPLNHSKLVESLPASPLRPVQEEDNSMSVTSAPDTPVVITIGDGESDEEQMTPDVNNSSNKTPFSSMKRDRTTPGGSPGSSVAKKKRKSSTGSSKQTKPELSSDAQKAAALVKKKGAIDATFSTTKFSQIGGCQKTIEEVKKLLLHMRYPEVYHQIGVTPPRGFLLHGPPGCGKSLMANAIAGELALPFYKLAATELVSGVSGESEERVRKLFAKAAATAPCILFIDEVDAITPKRETASKDMERRIVSQFLSCLDDLCEKKDAHVLVIGATNRPDSLDPALRRAGRFDREISMGIPDIKARESILRVLCKDIRLGEDFDYGNLSTLTPGFVGADLNSLVREAAMYAVNRIFTKLEQERLVSVSGPPSLSNPVAELTLDSGQKEASLELIGNESVEEEKRTSQPAESASATSDPQSTDKMEITEQEAVTEQKTSEENMIVQSPGPEIQTTLTQKQTKPETKETGCDWWKSLPSLPLEELASLYIHHSDFMEALKVVQPSAKREGFATVPDVTWADIGALKSIREELQMAILAPVKYPDQFKSLGLSSPSGVLLAGPPGCGKTLLAKAVANETGINFISVKGPELINMYVGESEKAVRQVFQRARNSSPCVVFFDELDSLCPRRSLSGSDGGSGSRIVNQLLTEMDGLEERKQVFVMGATNRPDIIDPAVLRPGRLDKILYVDLPTLEDRVDILRTITKNCSKPRIEGVDLAELAAQPQCDGFSGADLTALVREASMAAMKEYISSEMSISSSLEREVSLSSSQSTSRPAAQIVINNAHFEVALNNTKPSISQKDRDHYRKMAAGVR